MRDVVQVEMLERKKAGNCPLCTGTQVLTRRVTYYRAYSYSVCQTCGTALSRHLRWVKEARSRYLQNRVLRAVDGE